MAEVASFGSMRMPLVLLTALISSFNALFALQVEGIDGPHGGLAGIDGQLLELGEDAADLGAAGAGRLDHRRDVGQVGDGVFQVASLGQDLFDGRGRFVGVDADAIDC